MTLPARVLTVIREVAQEHGVKVHDILSPCRLRPVAWARHDAMLRVRALAWAFGNPPSYPKIGLWFNRDHSTVTRGCNVAKERVTSD